MHSRKLSFILAIALVAAVVAVGTGAPVQAGASCAAGSEGGDWPSYGHDLANTRTQPKEKKIDVAAVPHLEPAWMFSSVGGGGAGGFQSTPTIADGCVYAGTSAGWVFALNADNGKLVWKRHVGEGGFVGGIFSVTVQDGRVYANVSGPKGPYAAALDQDNGAVVWKTPPLVRYPGSYTNASAVVYKDLVFVGTSGPEGDEKARGSYVIIDADNGNILERQFVIPEEENKRGYGGAGIWSTAVVDTDTGYAYVGAGNPYGNNRDHRYSNAILKIDLNRDRRTFGEIVDAYKGNPDQYFPALQILADTPVCKNEQIPTTIDDPQCGQIDVDFGASPNLFVDNRGIKVVGALQKSGVYHAADAKTMAQTWTTVVGLPCAPCNAATSAYHGNSIFVVGTPGGVMASLNKNYGTYQWASPVGDGVHYQAVTVANGVVYTMDSTGNLDMFEEETGALVFSRPVSVDTGAGGDACSSLGSGVAVARNHVYATCDVGVNEEGWIISYGVD